MDHMTASGAGDAGAQICALEIGALEIGVVVSQDDAAIEATAMYWAGPSVRVAQNTVCINTRSLIGDDALEGTVVSAANSTMRRMANTFCFGIDDGMIENAAAVRAAGPTSVMAPGCYPHVDGGIEASASRSAGPTSYGSGRGCPGNFIDDSALEHTVQAGPSTHLKRNTVCLNIDDGALEASVIALSRPMTMRLVPNGPCVGISDETLEVAVTSLAGPTSRVGLPGCNAFIDDGALENVATSSVAAGPTRAGLPGCRPFADDVLENAAAKAAAGPTAFNSGMPGCPHFIDANSVNDGALEAAAGPGPRPPTFFNPQPICRHIDDETLEGTALNAASSTMRRLPNGMCYGIDDGALEAAAAFSAGPTRGGMPGCFPFADDALENAATKTAAGPTAFNSGMPGCPHFIDDVALESAVRASAGPTPTNFNSGRPGCPSYIEDGALEATVYGGPRMPVSFLKERTRCPWIDDGALEAAAAVSAGPTTQLAQLPGCPRRIDDDAVEAAGPTEKQPMPTRIVAFYCGSVDSALENLALSVGPTTGATMYIGCRHVDDNSLEASAAATQLEQPSTMGLMCMTRPGLNCVVRIDANSVDANSINDDVLEASAYTGPSRYTAIKLPGGACLPGLDDGALEATAVLTAGPTNTYYCRPTAPAVCLPHVSIAGEADAF